jgi:hypothetical protein
MCFYFGKGLEESIWCVGMAIFVLVWIIFVPVAITSRLERMIKLLEELNKK